MLQASHYCVQYWFSAYGVLNKPLLDTIMDSLQQDALKERQSTTNGATLTGPKSSQGVALYICKLLVVAAKEVTITASAWQRDLFSDND